MGNAYAQNAHMSDERQYISINVKGFAWGYSKACADVLLIPVLLGVLHAKGFCFNLHEK